MMTDTILKTTKKKIDKTDILDQIRRQIITMELMPGEPLDEVEICTKMGISRTPLREILIHLSGEGYIQIRENRGAFVSSMDYHSMRRFFQTAPMIYAAMSRLAAENATPYQIDLLAEQQQHFVKAQHNQSIGGMIYYNDRFHHQIGLIADNAFLMPSLKRLLIDHARIGNTFWNDSDDEQAKRITKASEDHDQLIEAIAAHDAEAAVAITVDHWQLSKDHIDIFIKPDPIMETDGNKDRTA